MTDEPTLGDLVHADGQRHARLAAAMDATPAAPSATQTPVQPEVGSRDERTSTRVSSALVAAALDRWETAALDGLPPVDGMRAALAVVVPYVIKQERQRTAELVRGALLRGAGCGMPVDEQDLENLARKIEGADRG